MNTPGERRYRYPFINCTHCGPRFTIIRAMPYDRPFTVMASFPLCRKCATEYRDPYDRRFHAQPVACPACGPHLAWRSGSARAEKDAALQAAVAMLKAGGIVAIKGIGGFHLACDAQNDEAVAMLRARKHRPAKPLAVMLPDTEGLPDAARRLLTTPAAPIVLQKRRFFHELCEGIAPGLAEVGVMLPANPLQHLLLQALNCPLVMTSGNLSGKPPAITNQQALDDLKAIADGFLLHNRDIVQRMDDSVVRDSGEMLRRSRGYVPDAIALPPGFRDVPPMLCLGADLKNTFCLVRGEQAGTPKKPAPDGAFAICRELGIKQEECLYLGDTNTDMETGLNAGMDTVGVLWGYRDREELEGCHPQYIVAHPSEVAEIVKKKNESHGRME